MNKDLLPIGSVIRAVNGEKTLMICARILTPAEDDTIYDYGAYLFPEGAGRSEELYLFNQEDIAEVLFIGFQDFQELDYRSKLNSLGELKVENGKFVEVTDTEKQDN
ncbi:MAG: DUF4176 domain-containing protein [Lachnospiraceae bacterium]|nr:DUF4176 domain-containing protein [Lachnospiraceae bacterium]